MNRPILKLILIQVLIFLSAGSYSQDTISMLLVPSEIVSTETEAPVPGRFEPTWESLRQYQVPEWFRDAKFGIWAHWGPQCQPEAGDWYARLMYFQGQPQYQHHLEHYGHPSVSGFKDIIHEWKAEAWDPDSLVAFYKEAGAKYFFAMASHHDNLDLWDSRHHEWNSVRTGPEKNLIAGWEAAARNNGLPFGVSVHSSRAWIWYEGAGGADTTGELKGVPYDGNLRREDGSGTWWEGLDPQVLYAQGHPHSANWDQHWGLWSQWHWNNGAVIPDLAYCTSFYNRTMDLIKRYHPDLIYFDDSALPLWPFSDAGLKIVSSFYNLNMQEHHDSLKAVVFGKVLSPAQREALVWDIERGVPPEMLPFPWQTCTCIGGWHYDRSLYLNDGYKSSLTVERMLADIISKNGNLLLNIPVRGDGSIDEKEVEIVRQIGAWLKINGEAVYGSRPWKIFGEGPASQGAALESAGFNEGKGKAYTADDVRFTVNGPYLYLFLLNCDGAESSLVPSLGLSSALTDGRRIKHIEQLGSQDRPEWQQTADGLRVKVRGDGVVVLKISGLIE